MIGLVNSIKSVAEIDKNVQSKPSCILWTDGDTEWQVVVPLLKSKLPELFSLGDYSLETRTGPAIWLRCAIERSIESVTFPEDCIPIIYLPKVSFKQLRETEGYSEDLIPLIELQYRGACWKQSNNNDWSIYDFLTFNRGLNLDVADDKDTKYSMVFSLEKLLNLSTQSLKSKRLDHEFFNGLSVPDLDKFVLDWLDHPQKFKKSRSENEWISFNNTCKKQLGFDPVSDGESVGVSRLVNCFGPWKQVWERYYEAPKQLSKYSR